MKNKNDDEEKQRKKTFEAENYDVVFSLTASEEMDSYIQFNKFSL